MNPQTPAFFKYLSQPNNSSTIFLFSYRMAQEMRDDVMEQIQVLLS